MASKTAAIGIDLGTTFSCAGVLTKGGRVEIIVNDLGHPTTPSAVCFNGDERLIGKAAMDKLKSSSADNTVYGVKRIIGRLFNEPSVQGDIQSWPFKVVAGAGMQPRVEVQYNGETKKFDIEEISEMVLGKLKENAEEFLGHEVKDAVITVPAYFNDSQRQATKTAGTIAGFNVLQVLNEPTAAAIAYGFKNPGEGKRTLLVFDLGGGTFDVSVLEVDGGKFDVRAVAGDTHLGGEDFDERMVQHCVAEFKKKGGKDISSNQKALPRLRAACVEAKHALSSGVQTSIEVAALADGIDFTTTMTRACFEAICEDLFEKTVDEVKKALEDAKLTKSDIDEVVLVGGSTRIPKVRQLLSKFFDSKDLKKNINPDEAVAYGAAILAAQLSGEASKQDEHVANSNVRLRDLALADITPLSLGLEIADGAMCTLIPRNSKIPVKETRECTTDLDHETYIVIKIYEGERALAKDNHHLANLTMSGFRSAKASGGIWPMIQVTFEIDTNGILHVSAQDKESGESTEVIVDGRGRLPKAEIERMIRDAETHKAQDAVVRAKLLAKDNLDRLVRKIQRALAASPGAIPPSEAQNVRDKCTEAERVLNDASKDELERLYADLDAVWQPIDGYF